MERTLPLCSITVRDTGVGISPDFLPLIFDRFRQEDSGSTRRYGGLGLGLTIVRHLVEMHGGSVSARSDGHDRGSTFTVRFPLSTEQPAGAPRHRRAEAADAPRLEGIRVLAVDDEPDARDFVVEVLQQAGAEARVADSIEDALRVLSEFPADVLLADLEMPGGDGFELLRRVREGGYGMPAIAVTAHTAVEDRIRVLSNGFSQHVAKPVETEELRLVVESVAAARTRGGPS
jgi:CheY-like chemotaxis protein